MAEEKNYTLESAKEFFTKEDWLEQVSDMKPEELISLDKAVYGQPISENVDEESKYIRQEAQKKIESLLAKETLSPDELDSIAAFVTHFATHTVQGESIYANDAAKALMDRVEKQKAEQEAQKSKDSQNDDIVVDQAQDNAKEEKQATTETKEEEQVKAEVKESKEEDKDDLPEVTSKDEENLQKAEDEVEKLPDNQEAIEGFNKEYGLDTLTKEQLEQNSKWMDEIDERLAEMGTEREQFIDALKEENELLDNLVVVDNKGKEVSEEKSKKHKETIREAANLEAETVTIASSRAKTFEEFYAEFLGNTKDSMRKAIVSTAFAENLKDKDGKPLDVQSLSQEKIGEAYAQAAQDGKKTPLKASIKSIADYAGIVRAEVNNIKEGIKEKIGKVPAVQKMESKIKKFDEKMSGKYGKYWDMAKRAGNIVLKKGKGIAIYGVVGATMGAPGLGILAIKSGYDTYKGFKQAAAKEGKTFGQYAMEHKLDVGLGILTTGLAAAGSAFGMGIGGEELADKIKPALKTATKALAIAPKAIKTAYYGAKLFAENKGWIKNPKKEETLASFNASKKELFDATVGILAGSMLNNLVQGGNDKETSTEKEVDTQKDPSNHNLFEKGHLENVAGGKENDANSFIGGGKIENVVGGKEDDANSFIGGGKIENVVGGKEDDANSFIGGGKIENVVGGKEDDANSFIGGGKIENVVDGKEGPVNLQDNAEYKAPWEQFTQQQFAPWQQEDQNDQIKQEDFQYFPDKDHDNIEDSIDPDHGQGWANATETQLNRAFDASPAAINEILNDGKWHSSSELHTMMENGDFSEEQLKAIHAYASKTFDENGSILDKDLNQYYEKLQEQNQTIEQESKQDDFSIEAMTHDTLAPMIGNEDLVKLEDLMAAAKENGDFSKVDAFGAEHGIDPKSEAGLALQDYINAGKGLSATGGEDPATFFNQEAQQEQAPESNMPSHQQMYDLALKTQDLYKGGMPMGDAFAQTLQTEIEAGNLSIEQAQGAVNTINNLMEENNNNPDKMLKDWVKGSEKMAAEELALQQEAAIKENLPSNAEMLKVLESTKESYEQGVPLGSALNQVMKAELEAGNLTAEQAGAIQQTLDKEWQDDGKNTDKTLSDMIKTYEQGAKEDAQAAQTETQNTTEPKANTGNVENSNTDKANAEKILALQGRGHTEQGVVRQTTLDVNSINKGKEMV